MADVLVVGAGPVGLTLAAELARHGVRCRVIDKAASPSPYCRAIGVTPRTLEVWEDMGVAREMIDAGLWITGLRTIVNGQPPRDGATPVLDLPYANLGIPQYETERVLARHLGRHGLAVERGVALTTLVQEPDGVHVGLALPDGTVETAEFRYVVGCDGAHSAVRRQLGIGFDGQAYPWPFMLGDVQADWDLPYGMALRALRLVEGGPPDLFVAIPLPEQGRYRVSMLAPRGLVPGGGTDHGIQAELTGPTLAELQAVADDLLPDKPRLSDLRWSSVFRISLRLAANYRVGRVFIAGDAAHIHPPTGGQGMNTGIQDAYNLAWKLGLVMAGAAPERLLDSYEAERQPVGADVLARTRAASEGYGREAGGAPDRLADSQVLVSYRGTALAQDEGDGVGPAAGDRAPDVQGLIRRGLDFPLRLFEILHGTEHVLLVPATDIAEFAALARDLRARLGVTLRVVAITPGSVPEVPGLTLIQDPAGDFTQAYGAGTYLVRPDGHIGWRGASWQAPGLQAYLRSIFTAA